MFNEFDPLSAKQVVNNEVAILALKREIRNILDSYVGWFDPFCELIQNSLDSLEERIENEGESFDPQLRVLIDLEGNTLTVSDNGTGLGKVKYEQFLAPSFSFKSGKARGHKGVGATYLAYGFNYIQIATKTADFEAVGKMLEARKWLTDESPASNPMVTPDSSAIRDAEFSSFESGVSITLLFDDTTRPGDVSWINATTAEQWMQILRLKTGAGSINGNSKIAVTTIVTAPDLTKTTCKSQGISYLWPHALVSKSMPLTELEKTEYRQYKKYGRDYRMPATMTNLDAIYGFFDSTKLEGLIQLDDTEKQFCGTYNPAVYFCYMNSAKNFAKLNEKLGIRQGQSIFTSGIQLAANDMPQGEIVQIPLRRNIGRQNQVHVVIHLENCRADLGRKGFQKEIVEFSQSISRKLIEKPIQKLRKNLRPVTGVKNDLQRENKVDTWKEEFVVHESKFPLLIKRDCFFLPTRRISITSVPTREQDVISLFNQLLAGGVIRGIKIMATSERFTYDGMYRVVIDQPITNHMYDADKNPLGVIEDYVERYKEAKTSFTSKPKILEYKFSLDGIIEDIQSGTKNSNDIDLVVVWECGSDYLGNYHITSLLDADNLPERQYHGVTHILTNVTTGQREMDLIILKDLIDFLNDPNASIAEQKRQYDADSLECD